MQGNKSSDVVGYGGALRQKATIGASRNASSLEPQFHPLKSPFKRCCVEAIMGDNGRGVEALLSRR
jgi:hypothetical protein